MKRDILEQIGIKETDTATETMGKIYNHLKQLENKGSSWGLRIDIDPRYLCFGILWEMRGDWLEIDFAIMALRVRLSLLRSGR